MEFNFSDDNKSQSSLNLDSPTYSEIFQVHDAIIFLVDIHSLYYQNQNISEKNIQIFFKIYKNFIKNKIINSSQNKISLIFYNTINKKNPLQFEGIYIYQDLAPVSAFFIKNCENVENMINSEIGILEGEALFNEVLWVCNNQFRNNCDGKNSFQRIFIFSNNDFPNEINDNKNDILEYVNIMYNSEVEIDVFPLVFEKGKFDFKKFYVDLLKIDLEDLNAGILEPSEKIEELNIKLKKKEFKKRVVFKTNLKLTAENKIAIKMFSLYKKLKKPTSIPLDARTNTRIKSITKNKCLETEQYIQNEKIGKYIEKGCEKIPFLDMELKQIKNLLPEEFRILGFKPKSSLKNYQNLGPSIFITPDDEIISNSSKVFDALIFEMLKKEKIGIARLKKNNSSIKFLALLPQNEKIDNNNLIPAGFNAIILPFADDIRDLKDLFIKKANLDPNKKDLEIAIELIDNLTINNFEVRNFENPDIQKFYGFLQALALNEERQDDFEDFLMPDFEGLKNKIEIIEKFNEHFDKQFEEVENEDNFDDLENLEKGQKKNKKKNNKDNSKENVVKKNGRKKKEFEMPKKVEKKNKRKNKLVVENEIFEEEEENFKKENLKKKKKNLEGKINLMDEEINFENILEKIMKNKILKKIIEKVLTGNMKNVTIKELDKFLKKFEIVIKGKKIEKFKKALKICNNN